uniref:Syntaxin 6/10/61 N-terminal domain-containing protein n=2 Tax=Ananas comosus var. bracteatus TaxID=296719 RepID=A0A6V7Q4I3_ANACO|nr:unnamed protein product [Ananas comosus var. bracteatus]
MATCFDRWEKDPFFSAAEEVQESADRMESVYRRWIQERRGATKPSGGAEFASAELQRELHTVLGTAKWQLEELERAVRSNDEDLSVGEDARARHEQFAEAIGSRITMVENSLKESNLKHGEKGLSWVRLDKGERDELALFLSGSSPQWRKELIIPSVGQLEVGNCMVKVNKEALIDCSKNSSESTESSSSEIRDNRTRGHRRVASASADIGSWKISIPSEGEDTSERSSDDRPNLPLPKILSLSGLAGNGQSKFRLKWYRNGFRKWKGSHQHDEEESIPLQDHQLKQGVNACYERSKSCLSTCGEETYNKQIYGWLGALHRQLQSWCHDCVQCKLVIIYFDVYWIVKLASVAADKEVFRATFEFKEVK